jgi:hypothetical protein
MFFTIEEFEMMGVGATFALLFVLLHTAASTGQIYFLHFTKI